MKSKLVALTLIAASTMALAAATPARAQHLTIRVDTPEFGIRIGHPHYRPQPIIVAPAPVYIPPPPVYVPPPPIYVPPPTVYYPAPHVVYAPPPVVYAPYPRHGRDYRHKHHRHHPHDDRRYGRHIDDVRIRY